MAISRNGQILNCLVFEKIAFLSRPHAIVGDRQTDKQTDRQTDKQPRCVKPVKNFLKKY